MVLHRYISRVVLAVCSCLALASVSLAGDFHHRGDSGYFSSGDNDQTIRCESDNYKFRRCSADTSGRVRLARELSDTPCRRGENWGYDARGIWVDNGCAAEFYVTNRYAERDYPDRYSRESSNDYHEYNSAPPTRRQTIRCESNNYEFQRCPADVSGRVRMTEQLSDTPCRRGENWGYDARGIWVDKGCAAEFRIAGR
jgi:hypothetical protein